MNRGFELDDLSCEVAANGVTDSVAGIPCFVVLTVWIILRNPEPEAP